MLSLSLSSSSAVGSNAVLCGQCLSLRTTKPPATACPGPPSIVAKAITRRENRTARHERIREKEVAKKVGEIIAKPCLEKGISKVAFDRGGYPYHGRIQSLC